MPSYCCVPGCKSPKAGHKFPANPNLNYKWRVAVRRVEETTKTLWKPMMHSKLCSDHFREDDYNSTLLNERKRLKEDAIPSIFPFNDPQRFSSLRKDRAKRRRLTANSTETVELHVPEVAEELELDYSPLEEDSPKVNHRTDKSFNPDRATICSMNFEESCFSTGPRGRRALNVGSLTKSMPQKSVKVAKPLAWKDPTPRSPPPAIERVAYLDGVRKAACEVKPPWKVVKNSHDGVNYYFCGLSPAYTSDPAVCTHTQ